MPSAFLGAGGLCDAGFVALGPACVWEAGITTACPQPGHLSRLPASSSLPVSFFLQPGHWMLIDMTVLPLVVVMGPLLGQTPHAHAAVRAAEDNVTAIGSEDGGPGVTNLSLEAIQFLADLHIPESYRLV